MRLIWGGAQRMEQRCRTVPWPLGRRPLTIPIPITASIC